MDDFVLSNLNESRNEWCARLVSTLTPLIMGGTRSIFNESWKLCVENDESNKYLMTFQNLLSRVPKWNNEIIEEERKRIIERSGCNYLEDLITCVHIIQLKVLTCVRVGNKQKKIDISIPKLDSFIHKVYINVARKVYSNVYLFDKNVSPLQGQKNNRELENIVQESILISIRESIPTEAIIRAYMDESVEQEEEVIIEDVEDEEEVPPPTEVPLADERSIEEDAVPEVVPSIQNIDNEDVITKLSFNDLDAVLDENDDLRTIDAPKSIERLEEIGTERAIKRHLEEEDDDRLQISTEQINLHDFDELGDIAGSEKKNNDEIILNDVEELY
tara:strand:+ start:3383 stop:4375 length:993 start_codon:yes stop_codon:yes gene_type:complete